jgi:hypothetical protein
MSSGNATTECTRRELADDAAVIERWALVRNDVLVRALAIAALEYVTWRAGGVEPMPDAGTAVMLCWVMQASDEIERAGRLG